MLSEWNYEGHYPRPTGKENPDVRVEINTTIGHGLSLGWMVSNTRRFGEFARMGLRVGVQGDQGLVFSVPGVSLGKLLNFP
jgi:DnaJ family protein C protein 11